MADDELTKVLLSTLNPDNNIRDMAQKWLDSAKQSNLPGLATALADQLANTQKPTQARQQAGIQLKNCIAGQHSQVTHDDVERWKAFPAEGREKIKQLAVQTLGSEGPGPSTAAQVVTAIASIEVPLGGWLDVVPQIIAHMQSNQQNAQLQVAGLESLGYLAEAMNKIGCDALAKNVNELLTAVVQRLSSGTDPMKLAAIHALSNALEFCRSNFERQQERDVIMSQVCTATQNPNEQLVVASLQCLIKIVTLYYQHMEAYMGPACFRITLTAMDNPQSDIKLQAIEFWSSLAEEEENLIFMMEEAAETGQKPEIVCKEYTKQALGGLLPKIFNLLAQQDSDDDDDDFTPCKAAAVCLNLVAQCCRSPVLAPTIAFVEQNMQNQHWQFRDAAVMAFGAVLEGPSEQELIMLTQKALIPMTSLMKDPTTQVKDSVAWLLGRICETTPTVVLQDGFLPTVLAALSFGLEQEAKVAAGCCWAINTLVESAYKLIDDQTDGSGVPTYQLSPHFQAIVQKLLTVAERPDANEGNLRLAAYEAVMNCMQYPADDCYATIAGTTGAVLDRLEKALSIQPSDQAQLIQAAEIQSLLTATLGFILRSLKPGDAVQIGERVFKVVTVLVSTPAGKAGNVQEDALLTISALIDALQDNFLPFIPQIQDFVLSALANVEFYQVCYSAVGVVGDLGRQLGNKFVPYCDAFMNALAQTLMRPGVHRSVKPPILSTFGDLALACGKEFTKYLATVMNVLAQAFPLVAQSTENSDFDEVEHINELREGVLDAFTGIIQALAADDGSMTPELQSLGPYLQQLVQVMQALAADRHTSDAAIRSMCGIIGDVCKAFGPSVSSAFPEPFTNELQRRASTSDAPSTKTMGNWMKKQLRKIRQ